MFPVGVDYAILGLYLLAAMVVALRLILARSRAAADVSGFL